MQDSNTTPSRWAVWATYLFGGAIFAGIWYYLLHAFFELSLWPAVIVGVPLGIVTFVVLVKVFDITGIHLKGHG